MIISNSLKFVFVAIPKTGTHSIRMALRPSLSPEDMEQVGLFVQKKLPFTELANIGHGHISIAQVRPFIGEENFAEYFKFSFVRNPFDRFVSYAAFTSRETGEFRQAPLPFMKNIIQNIQPWSHILYRPQHEFLIGADGSLQVDFVGRLETMQSSFDDVADRIGIARVPLETVNRSAHRDFAEYYDQELFELVSNLYYRDIEMFGYSLNGFSS